MSSAPRGGRSEYGVDGYPGDVRITADAITVAVTGSGPQSELRLVVGTPSR